MSVYKPNNDHELKTVFTENIPIIKFVSHDVFEDNDWKDFIQQCPDGADPFEWCVWAAGIFRCDNIVDDKFDTYAAYCASVIQSIAKDCNVECSDDRLIVLAYGLAARTFNFEAAKLEKSDYNFDVMLNASDYECTDDIDFLSMWEMLVMTIRFIRFLDPSNIKALIKVMKKVNSIRDKYNEVYTRMSSMTANC